MAATVVVTAHFGTACGGSSNRPVPAGPSSVEGVDPCIDLEESACPARLAFVRKAFNSTVRLHVSRYTVKKGMEYAAGTGEVIDRRGTVLSAYHVVEDGRQIVASIRNIDADANASVTTRDVPMKIIASNPNLDIVLLQPSEPGETLPVPFVIRRDPPKAGEQLWHFGNVSSWSHGKVTKTDTDFADRHGLTKVSFPCRHGDSGGPFVDMQGRLVGVLLLKDNPLEGRGSTFYLPVGAALDALGYKP